MADQHYLSRAALERLQAEFTELTTSGRIEIARAIERARELGDLSENGDYQAAKDQQGMMEGRIRQLESILMNATVVEGSEAGVVGPGMIVTLLYDGDPDDMAERYLFGHIEERTDLDVISPGSPLGAALNGRPLGAVIEYSAPNGKLKVHIKAIELA
jgi:transcription elongation factor GreA